MIWLISENPISLAGGWGWRLIYTGRAHPGACSLRPSYHFLFFLIQSGVALHWRKSSWILLYNSTPVSGVATNIIVVYIPQLTTPDLRSGLAGYCPTRFNAFGSRLKPVFLMTTRTRPMISCPYSDAVPICFWFSTVQHYLGNDLDYPKTQQLIPDCWDALSPL